MHESPTKLRAELLAFYESREKNLVPLIGWRQDNCDYQPPRVVLPAILRKYLHRTPTTNGDNDAK